MNSSTAMQNHLDRLYTNQTHKFAFKARTLKEYTKWQAAFQEALQALVGLAGRVSAAAASKVYSHNRGCYLEEKYTLEVGEGVQAPLYVLVPKGKPPFKPVLVFHGHDPSAQYCLGHYPDPETAQANLAIDNNYAQAFAKTGYLVGVVEQRGLGERLTGQVSVYRRSCRHLAFSYLMHGRTLLGERIWDGLCAVSALLARPDVTGGLGCTGHSGGGATALWLAALDPRISVVVVSGYFSSFHSSILAMEHCECNYVPGILELAEVGEIAALLAPRPFCAINGQGDPLFPLKGALEQFETVRRAYRLHRTENACQLSIHPGGHAYDNSLAQDWFGRWL